MASDREQTGQPKVGKAKQKKAKKAARKPAVEFQCVVCKAEFPSKTRLFNHIEEEDHAAPLKQVKAVKTGKGKKK
jgi:DnaJ family protein A protein 5